MKLYEYVLQQPKEKWRVKFCQEENIPINTYFSQGFCPPYFECFKGTDLAKHTYPYAKANDDCCKEYNKNGQRCIDCWNREIEVKESEYEIYMRLKVKYEGDNT